MSGLRNWRGEIVEKTPTAVESGADVVTTRTEPPAAVDGTIVAHTYVSAHAAGDPGRREIDERREKKDRKKEKKEKRESPVFAKDEFGRDVEVTRERKKKAKKSKREEKERRGRASPSPHSALVGTPPPADPYRPQTFTPQQKPQQKSQPPDKTQEQKQERLSAPSTHSTAPQQKQKPVAFALSQPQSRPKEVGLPPAATVVRLDRTQVDTQCL